MFSSKILVVTNQDWMQCMGFSEPSFVNLHQLWQAMVAKCFYNRGYAWKTWSHPLPCPVAYRHSNLLSFLFTGACEGTLSCSTCHLIFDPDEFAKLDLNPPNDEELDMLDLAYGLCDT